MPAPKVYRWERLPREDVRRGVSRVGFRGSDSMLCMNWLEPGMEVRMHSHPEEQLAIILQGRMRFHFADGSVEVGAGEVLRIPPDVEHGGEVVGDETVVNLDVFAPLREDYLHLVSYQAEDFRRN